MPGFDALTIGRAQLWSFGSAKTFGSNTVNEFHVSLMRNANNVGVPNGGHGVSARVAGLRHRPGHAGHRRAGAAVRRRREPRVQHVHDGRDDHRRQSDRRHAAPERQRLEGVGRAHGEVRRPVSVPAGAPRAERDVQRHVHVCRHGDRIGLRRLPARRPEQLHPVVRRRRSTCATSTAACSRRTAGARGRT